ncbi:hypothetical protein HMPREF1624_04006 [Sporothrix schenckii ATCC 58251]|uniref:Thymocyte nuclear protein 1 n=1 Tax=Sporothrix schenckii (strain ATCC 58251 / de Perez 2211183) TaxID=1391915 RepID=U7PV38_SPOS1|nr:hypothetical protein HMPREF1624_04006 [Sporothrix schenckii ATCC 58251]
MPPRRKSTAATAKAEPSTPARRSSRRAAPIEESETKPTKPTPPAKRAPTGKTAAEAEVTPGPSMKRKAASTPAPAQAPPAKKIKGKATAKGKGRAVATAKDAAKDEPVAEEGAAAEQDQDGDTSASTAARQYWLLKAEPESRFENGVDVRFSIDDLAACTAPEPWDGIRNYTARNNLRKMKKGDLAFFYHSNTKEPGIVGTMTIVREHSPDLGAHDPKTAYYDPKAAADLAAGKEPKWSVVHVQFRSKFARPIFLKELKDMGAPGQPLDKMQMLKQSRLSVSQVSADEWKHLLRVAGES